MTSRRVKVSEFCRGLKATHLGARRVVADLNYKVELEQPPRPCWNSNLRTFTSTPFTSWYVYPSLRCLCRALTDEPCKPQSLTPAVLRRLMRELSELQTNPPEGIRIVTSEDNMLDVTGIIQGPGE